MEKNTNSVKNKTIVTNYWQDRAEKTYLLGEKDALKVARHLKNLYTQTINEINEKINSFYGKYASQNGLTLEEARQLLNRNELKDFKAYIDKMIAMGNKDNFSTEEMHEFNRLYNKAKITRLEELQANIRAELDKLAVKTVENVDNLLSDTYEEGYYKTIYDVQIGINSNKAFSGLNKQAIEKAVYTKYQKSNFSNRIWTNTNNLMNILTNEIPRGIVLGYNPKKLAKEVVNKRVDKTAYNNTVRLIRTEYSHILNQATIDGYKTSGINQYKILTTLDSRRCEDCEDFEGKIVDVSEATEGVDLPPFHPNCRCTTIPYFEKDEIDEMTDEELSKIGFITYDEWKNGLIKLENGKVKYSKEVRIDE